FPRARFSFVGPIPEGRRLARLRRLGNVDHCEALPRQAVLDLLRGAHVLFHPARHESYGMVLAEAAAAGMAVITSCAGRSALVRLAGDSLAGSLERYRRELGEPRLAIRF